MIPGERSLAPCGTGYPGPVPAHDPDHALLLDTVDATTADLACDLLDGAGIPYLRHAPDFDVAELGAAAHAAVRGVSVLVPRSALEDARTLLDDAWGPDA